MIVFLDKTFAELPKPLCLNENEHYKLQLQLKKYGHGDKPRDPVISIDSVFYFSRRLLIVIKIVCRLCLYP